MRSLLHAPLFKLCLFFLAGIWTAKYHLQWPLWLILPGCLLLGLGLIRERKYIGYRWEGVLAVSIVLVFLGLGNAWYLARNWNPRDLRIDALAHCRVQLMGCVISEVRENEFGRRTWMALEAYREDSLVHSVTGRVQLYLKPEDTVSISLNDTLITWADVVPARSKYPSYLAYLQDNGIRYFAYSKNTSVIPSVPSCWDQIGVIRGLLSRKLVSTFSDSLLAGIAQAMYLGDKRALDVEVRHDFAAAGLSHILAISGLHVGIVFLALSALLSPLHRIPYGLRIKNLIILIFLIAYMVLTGLSPAVVRAVLMFGTILLFRIIYKRYNMLNLLAISAMIQMLVHPDIIFNIGFQLSYLAVCGIVIGMPVFEKWFFSRHNWLNKLYGWIGISLIATCCTAPLIWHYFGQFPTYFIVSNVLVSCITFFVVLLGFVAILLVYIPGLNTCMGILCEKSLALLYGISQSISHWPYSVIRSEDIQGMGIAILIIELVLTVVLLFLPRMYKKYGNISSIAGI